MKYKIFGHKVEIDLVSFCGLSCNEHQFWTSNKSSSLIRVTKNSVLKIETFESKSEAEKKSLVRYDTWNMPGHVSL